MYYAQIFKPPIGEYNILELKVHTINEELHYFTGCETSGSKRTLLFNAKALGSDVFIDRKEALKKVKEAENKYKGIKISQEKEYEEY